MLNGTNPWSRKNRASPLLRATFSHWFSCAVRHGFCPKFHGFFLPFRLRVRKSFPEKQQKSPQVTFATAVIATSLATLTCYPLDTIRRQMQVTGCQYTSVFDAFPGKRFLIPLPLPVGLLATFAVCLQSQAISALPKRIQVAKPPLLWRFCICCVLAQRSWSV